ncbi:hypothetical protein VVD49_05190 [Uliginosibacterium sp. H3]|uniref:Transmembrane protein n=1 Tax=Uliginosibacterium silvisoli TaxID=3114758 RepID=A0ABU6K097_9RHOO|nr:hypothetical protein [Uliginosibacterium sp. H3]
MIVPDYWAEARRQHKTPDRQITVRRFGWSMLDEADALSMAAHRADDALQRLVSGEKLARSERKLAYNGADGVPIREEVLSRHGEEVITRNAYGAHCLNSPRALFADVDFKRSTDFKLVLLIFAVLEVCGLAGFGDGSWGLALGLTFVSFLLAYPAAVLVQRLMLDAQGGAEQLAYTRIVAFVKSRPTWSVRLYRTPAGYRLLATHQAFEAVTEEVQDFFNVVRADPIYVRMCINQRCFRARLTAKPWRIGIASHMRPRPGVWPINPERMAERAEWVSEYEARASAYAACTYLENIGPEFIHAELRAVVELHDRESRALAPDVALA